MIKYVKSICLVGLLFAGWRPPARALMDTNCGDNHAATYKAAPDDASSTTLLQAARMMPATITSLEVNVCAGDLRIETAPRGSKLQVRISSSGADRSLREYLHDLDAQGGTVRVDVRVPNQYHATVTLLVPALGSGQSKINLGAGNLTVDASALTTGQREINVGAGTAILMLNGTHDYANLKVNVGMGHFEDQRSGGQSESFVIAREMSGSGRGDLEVNVGAGKVLLRPKPQWNVRSLFESNVTLVFVFSSPPGVA